MNPKPEAHETLVKNGFDVNATNDNNETAILIASERNQNLQVIETLKNLGADTEISNTDSLTPYDVLFDRISGNGNRYNRLSKEYDQKLLESLL